MTPYRGFSIKNYTRVASFAKINRKNPLLPPYLGLGASNTHTGINIYTVDMSAKISPYFRHKVGVNSTKIVNTSSRPRSIAAEHTQV